MDRYKSHKEVEAFKITSILYSDARASLIGENIENPDLTDVTDVIVDSAYIAKHNPAVGGYYVKYLDGYESWSPAEAFEDGYTKIE